MPRRSMCLARKPRQSCAGLGIKPGRLQFCSNPWGNDEEGWSGDRYGGFTHPGKWRECVTAAYGLLQHMKKAPAILVPAILVTGVES